MPRTSAKFTQADVARAVRAAAACDKPMEVILETDGRIRIVPSAQPQTIKNVDEPARLRI